MKIVYFHNNINLFIRSLEDRVSAKVNSAIKYLSIEEYHLSMPYSKKIEKDIYELRISSIQNIRIFYTFYENSIVVLHAIKKTTQKLELRDLKTARQRLRDLHS
jgi:phage-related protein